MTARNTGWRFAVVAAAMVAAAHPAAAQQPGEVAGTEVTFSAEVTVTHTIVDRTGKVTRELPGSRHRLERLDGGRVRMTMLATRANPRSGPLADAYAGITVDTDAATGGMRVRDRQGKTIQLASTSGLAMPPASTDDGLVVTSSGRGRRTAAWTEQFGRPVGLVRALHRYLARRGRVVEEALVAPDTALPLELNRLEDGILVEHHTFEYATLGEHRLVRVRTRSETALPQGKGARMVSLTTLSDIRVNGGAQ